MYHRKKDGSASIMETFKTESGVMIAFEQRDAQGNRTSRSAIALDVSEVLTLARELQIIADEILKSEVQSLSQGGQQKQAQQQSGGQAQQQSGGQKQRVQFKQV